MRGAPGLLADSLSRVSASGKRRQIKFLEPLGEPK
jgi:hypothetical protein